MYCRGAIREAQRLLAKGEHSAASDLLEGYASREAADPAVYRLLAKIRMLQGRMKEAIPLLHEALRLHGLIRQGPGPTCDGSARTATKPHPGTTSGQIEAVDDDDLDLIQATAADRRATASCRSPEFGRRAATQSGSTPRDQPNRTACDGLRQPPIACERIRRTKQRFGRSPAGRSATPLSRRGYANRRRDGDRVPPNARDRHGCC